MSSLSPGAGAAASLRLCHFMCDRSPAHPPSSADRPQRRGTYRGNYWGRLCSGCGGEGGRTAAWQGFVLLKREQANQTETFEGS